MSTINDSGPECIVCGKDGDGVYFRIGKDKEHHICETCWYDIKGIPEDQLEVLPYTEYKWHCAHPDCNKTTTLRDYGLFPRLFWPLKSKRKWFDTDRGFMGCFKHFRYLVRTKEEKQWTSKLTEKGKKTVNNIPVNIPKKEA